MRIVLLVLLLGLSLMAACAPADSATAPPTETATTNTPAPTIAPADSTLSNGEPSAVVFGHTAEGAYFHGAADAPVTLTDYSDFL